MSDLNKNKKTKSEHDELIERIRKALDEKEKQACPTCGRCPTCGHAPYRYYHWRRTYPIYEPFWLDVGTADLGTVTSSVSNSLRLVG